MFLFLVLAHRSLTNLWVQAHFDEALTARLRGSDSKKLATKGVRGKSAVEKLSQEALLTLATRVKMQVTFLTHFFFHPFDELGLYIFITTPFMLWVLYSYRLMW